MSRLETASVRPMRCHVQDERPESIGDHRRRVGGRSGERSRARERGGRRVGGRSGGQGRDLGRGGRRDGKDRGGRVGGQGQDRVRDVQARSRGVRQNELRRLRADEVIGWSQGDREGQRGLAGGEVERPRGRRMIDARPGGIVLNRVTGRRRGVQRRRPDDRDGGRTARLGRRELPRREVDLVRRREGCGGRVDIAGGIGDWMFPPGDRPFDRRPRVRAPRPRLESIPAGVVPSAEVVPAIRSRPKRFMARPGVGYGELLLFERSGAFSVRSVAVLSKNSAWPSGAKMRLLALPPER